MSGNLGDNKRADTINRTTSKGLRFYWATPMTCGSRWASRLAATCKSYTPRDHHLAVVWKTVCKPSAWLHRAVLCRMQLWEPSGPEYTAVGLTITDRTTDRGGIRVILIVETMVCTTTSQARIALTHLRTLCHHTDSAKQ